MQHQSDGNGYAAASVRWMWFDRTLKIINILILGVGLLAVRWALGVDTRLAAMQVNQLTSADGQEIWMELASKIDREDVPPLWFQNEVNELKEEMTELRRLLIRHINNMERDKEE